MEDDPLASPRRCTAEVASHRDRIEAWTHDEHRSRQRRRTHDGAIAIEHDEVGARLRQLRRARRLLADVAEGTASRASFLSMVERKSRATSPSAA